MNEVFDKEEMAWLAKDIVHEECLGMNVSLIAEHLEARGVAMSFNDMEELVDMINHEMKIEVAVND